MHSAEPASLKLNFKNCKALTFCLASSLAAHDSTARVVTKKLKRVEALHDIRKQCTANFPLAISLGDVSSDTLDEWPFAYF